MSDTPRWPKTLADYPALVAALRVHKDAPHDPKNALTEVFAPCCGRRTPADTVIDVRGIKGTVVAGGGFRKPKDHDWLCDGCVHRMILTPDNDWTHSKLYEALGAPPDVVLTHRAWERAAELARADHAAGKPHDARAAQERARKEVGLAS